MALLITESIVRCLRSTWCKGAVRLLNRTSSRTTICFSFLQCCALQISNPSSKSKNKNFDSAHHYSCECSQYMMSSAPRHLLFGRSARKMSQNSHFPCAIFSTQKSMIFVSDFCVFPLDTTQKTQRVRNLSFFFCLWHKAGTL